MYTDFISYSAQKPFVCRLLLLSTVVFSCSMQVCAEVDLVAYDCYMSSNDLVVGYCPNLDYTLIVDCRVVGTSSLEWSSPNFYLVTFTSSSNVHVMRRGSFTFTFTTIGDNKYISQLQVTSGALGPTTVTCKASIMDIKQLTFEPIG